jgi:Uma2 family endonuclease
VKLPLYAEAGITESWLVDLPGQVVEVCRDPRGKSYAVVTRHARGEVLSPLAFPDIRVAVDAILGPP